MNAPSRPALVVLAAGASRRLGTCKALVELGDRTALERLLAAGAGCDGAPPLVIAGCHALEIGAALPAGVELAVNPNWDLGRTGGVDLARRERPGLDLVLAPVDCPLVPAAVFGALVVAWLAAGCPPRGWLAPAQGCPRPRPGHPILVGRELLSELSSFDPDQPLRDLRARAAPLWTAEVASATIHDDLDTPAELTALRVRLRGE